MSSSKNSESASGSVTKADIPLTDKLQSAIDTTCQKFVSSVKFSRMKKNFIEIYNANPEVLKNIHDQLCSQLRKSISEDLDQLCKEHSIDFLLNSLDVIKKDQDSSECSWRPSGNPKEDLRDHIYPLKVKHKEDLQAVVTKLMISNEELINIATVNHAEILHIKKSNDDLYEKFSTITTTLTGTNMRNLQDTLDSMIEKT